MLKKYITILTIFILGIIYYIMVRVFHIGIPCVLYELTHLYCPGCGMTRAIMALSRLEIYQAFRYNSVLFIAVPTLLAEWYFKKHGNIKISARIIVILTIIVLAYGILRNFEIFSFLRPTIV